MRSDMSLPILATAIFVHMYLFMSLPQMIVLVIVVTMNESQSMNAVCNPEYCGIARMMHASPMTMRSERMSSVSMSFHMPFEASCISFALKLSLPWCIRIQSFPNIGPCHTAPNPNMITVEMMIAIQLSVAIGKKIRSKTLTLYQLWEDCKSIMILYTSSDSRVLLSIIVFVDQKSEYPQHRMSQWFSRLLMTPRIWYLPRVQHRGNTPSSRRVCSS